MSTSPHTAARLKLLVEGPDDEHVVYHILESLKIGLPEDFPSKEKAEGKFKVVYKHGSSKNQGKQALLELFTGYFFESGLEAIGIIVDADKEPAGTWEKLISRLTEQGYPPESLPKKPAPGGSIIDAPPEPTLKPRVGIWIMPDNSSSGALEDFLSALVPADDKLLGHAKTVLDGLPAIEPATEKLVKGDHRQKALMHTWLAWQKEPGKPYGQAIKARYLNAESEQGKVFGNWLKRTFWPE